MVSLEDLFWHRGERQLGKGLFEAFLLGIFELQIYYFNNRCLSQRKQQSFFTPGPSETPLWAGAKTTGAVRGCYWELGGDSGIVVSGLLVDWVGVQFNRLTSVFHASVLLLIMNLVITYKGKFI